MLDSKKIDGIVAELGLGGGVTGSDLLEIVELASSNGLLSSGVVMFPTGAQFILTLAVSDEVRLTLMDPVSTSDLLDASPAGATVWEEVRAVIERVEELLTDLKDAATSSRLADWKLVSVAG